MSSKPRVTLNRDFGVVYDHFRWRKLALIYSGSKISLVIQDSTGKCLSVQEN